jgi:hypothetical protein
MSKVTRGAALRAACALVVVSPVVAQSTLAATGPSSSQSPYIVPLVSGVTTTSILTVGDNPGTPSNPTSSYQMVGIPDGLGAYDNGNGTLTILMNHELGVGTGATRAHGQKGAFVSEWVVDKTTLGVNSGSDLITSVVTSVVTGSTELGRFCSADLAAPTAYFNAGSGLGSQSRIYMTGEEVGAEGRAFGTIATGTDKGKAYELPHLGKFSWENSVANPLSQNKTIVVGTDDSTPGEVYVYVGTKTNTGTEVAKAGLTNGNLYGVKVTGIPDEAATGSWAGGASTPFTLHNHGDVSSSTGTALQVLDDTANVTAFRRPEDGQWDPSKPNDFYFVTTNGVGSPSRLWRMRFSDSNLTDGFDPETGGQIQLLIDGQDPTTVANGFGGRTIEMMDNMTVDKFGRVFLQEDPGGNARSSKIWMYDIATDQVVLIAEHDRTRFGGEAFGTTSASLPTSPFNNNEEASGIIDASDILGDGWYLMDVQAHYTTGLSTTLVEGGQLLAMYVPTDLPVPEPTSAALLAGAAGLTLARRRRTR